MTDNKISVRQDTALSTSVNMNKNMDIRGLEDIPTSYVPLPRVKLIATASQSLKTKDENGNSVPVGKFVNQQTGQIFDTLKFHILRSKPGIMHVTDPKTKEEKDVQVFNIVALDPDSMDVFLLSVSGTSFWGFRQLLGKLKGQKVKAVWECEVIAAPEQREGDYGPYVSINFNISKKENDEGKLQFMQDLYVEWGGAVDAPGEEPAKGTDPADDYAKSQAAADFAQKVFSPEPASDMPF